VSAATVSAAGAALLQDTNDTDAVRAIAATAAKTNFFIIFFYFNLLNNQYAFKTSAKLRTFKISILIKNVFFYFLTKKDDFRQEKGFLLHKKTTLLQLSSLNRLYKHKHFFNRPTSGLTSHR